MRIQPGGLAETTRLGGRCDSALRSTAAIHECYCALPIERQAALAHGHPTAGAHNQVIDDVDIK